MTAGLGCGAPRLACSLLFPSALGGDAHKLDIYNRSVRTHLCLRGQVSLCRFCWMQVELHAFVQVPKPFCSRDVALWLAVGPRRKALYLGASWLPLLPLLPAPGGKPNPFPTHPLLKPTKQFTNPYLFVCLWLLPMLLIAPRPSLLFERAAV